MATANYVMPMHPHPHPRPRLRTRNPQQEGLRCAAASGLPKTSVSSESHHDIHHPPIPRPRRSHHPHRLGDKSPCPNGGVRVRVTMTP